ncbi:FecR family protein [Novosphingobium mangrovi (ex Huang et al. 2023)]|uniref:FecR domain-containing protein n=1 Tax=Novosphingobium mangrovi (ex Huang et al. 2023) TaxID=2976432 RepID=A0ABT2I8L3_9SPHN|nr:FecR domain-containing protein [Novosphingobium mangrovi (ex Huang et al. 2023)]MCT2401165.1 FecR domain-containing protein [Novosphingobium mangrovi (ex Huang et al. 2023)]
MKDRQITEEATYWLEQMNSPVVDVSVARGFDKWMDADARHRDVFSDLQGLWDSPLLTGAARLSNSAPQPEAEEMAGGRKKVMASMAFGLMVAAIALLVLALPGPLFMTDIYRTDRGAGDHITLADGSRATLSGDAELEVRILPWKRTAVLRRGEVFLDIAHERFRGFTVESGSAEIKVLGTAFNVDRQGEQDTVVQVYRGVVGLEGPTGEYMVLRKGQAAKATAHHLVWQSDFMNRSGPDWIAGWFEMSNEPLGLLVEKLDRYSEHQIRIDDETLARRRVSGRFHISRPASVLSALKYAYGVTVVDKGDVITLQ